MAGMTIFELDKQARERIKNDINVNFFVEAGAGSGKTTSLVDRMVAMVKSGIDVSEICAITFTKAAANEFYGRFQEALSKEAATDTNCDKALNNIDLCFMGTIDSFCNMVISEHPIKAGVPSDAAICDDDEIKALYKREYSKIQNGEEPYGTALKDKCDKFRNMYGQDEKVFVALLSFMMGNRNAVFETGGLVGKTLPDVIPGFETEFKHAINVLVAHPDLIDNSGDKSSKAACEYLKKHWRVFFTDWEENLGNVVFGMNQIKDVRLVKEIDLTILGMMAEDIFAPHYSRNKLAWYELNTEPDCLMKRLENFRSSHALDFVRDCVEPVAEKLKKEGKLTYFDYQLYLRNVLQDDAADEGLLIKHISERHKYFLMDEFQDTNPLQAEIFFYLAAEHLDADWRKSMPRPGSLFIVGDPKQSIYRFRGADVASFNEVKDLFKSGAGEILELTKNFRSVYTLKDWFNKVFKALMPADTKNQSKFKEIPVEDAPECEEVFEGVYYYDSNIKGDNKPKDQEAVTSIIKRLVNNPDYLITEKVDGKVEKREITYKDFMVITPTSSGLEDCIKEFSDVKIPFHVEGAVLFDDCPSLAKTVAIFSAVADRYDKLHQFGIAELDRLEKEKVQVEYCMCSALFGHILEKHAIFETFGTKNIESVFFVLELLKKAEKEGTVASLREGVDFLFSLLKGERKNERCLSLAKDENKVHVANLHKVKGLEAPIVILAHPNKTNHEPSIRIERNSDGNKGWIMSVTEKKGNNITIKVFSNTLFDKATEDEREALDAENIRLLYVAATRAKNVLIIGKNVKKDGEPSETQNAWGPLLEYCKTDFFTLPEGRPQIAVAPFSKKASGISWGTPEDWALDKDGEEEWGPECDPIDSLEPSYEIKKPSTVHTRSKKDAQETLEEYGPDDIDTGEADEVCTADGSKKPEPNIPGDTCEQPEDSGVVENAGEEKKKSNKKSAALIGTMVHRLMEVLVSSKNRCNLHDAVKEIVSEYNGTAIHEAMLVGVGQKMLNGGYPQKSSVPQDILKELLGAEEVYCEMPFCYKDEPVQDPENWPQIPIIWDGVMDVVYKDSLGWHIIDYKTNFEVDDLDQKYQAQLEAYKRAIWEMAGEDADALIYHIDVEDICI